MAAPSTTTLMIGILHVKYRSREVYSLLAIYNLDTNGSFYHWKVFDIEAIPITWASWEDIYV